MGRTRIADRLVRAARPVLFNDSRMFRMNPLAAALVLMCCWLPSVAADLVWPVDHGGDRPPAGWEPTTGEGAAIRFEAGRLLFQALPHRHALLSHDLASDGSDAAPLIVTATVAAEKPRELGGIPTGIAVWWDAGHAVQIGLGGMSLEGVERWEPGRRRGWAQWIVAGAVGRDGSEQPLYSNEAPAHLRLVITSNDVSAAISADGVTWHTLATLPRAGTALAKPPVRVVVGRMLPGDEADKRKPLLANDGRDSGWKESFTTALSALQLTTGVPTLPRARLVTKAAGFEDVAASELTASTVDQWHVLGPLPPSDQPYGIEYTRDTSAGLPLISGQEARWKPFVGDHDGDRRTLNLKKLTGATREHQVVYAAATITCTVARWERLWFDGARAATLFVNGRQVADKRNSWESDIVPDRFAATVPLVAGTNLVLVRLRTAHEGTSRLALRHEPAAPTQRVADLTQAIAAFTAEGDGCVAAYLEIARWWEVLGQRRLAAEALGRGLERDGLSGTQVDALSFSRARLHRELRDDGAVLKDIEELARRRLMGEDLDRPTTRLNLVRLWESMGFPERALAAADELAKDATTDGATLAEAALERARLRLALNQESLIAAELRTVAARLPASDPLAFEFQLQAMARDRDSAPALAVAGSDRARQARVFALQAGMMEAAGKPAERSAALRRLASVRDGESTWESLQSELAEALAANGDLAGAVAAYRLALERAPGAGHALVTTARKAAEAASGDAALGRWRVAAAHAVLADSEVGARLLQEALKTPTALPAGDGEPLVAPVVTDFHVIGPFPNPDFIAYGKPPVDPAKVDLRAEIQGKRWTRPEKSAYRDGILNLSALLNANECVAFVYRAVAVPQAGDGELLLGADDGLVVWFNGKKVHEDRESRGVVPGQIRIPVRFNAGTNQVLCMIQNGNGDWGVHLRIGGAATGTRGLADVLALLEQGPRRVRAAEALLELITGEIGSERAEEATALARLATRALSDAPAVQIAIAQRMVEERRERPRLLRDAAELMRWLLAASERRAFAGRDEVVQTLPLLAARLLLDSGDAAGAATALTRQIGATLDADIRRKASVGLAELYRLAGYPQEAATLYRRLEQRPDVTVEQRQAIRDGLQRVRGARADGAAFPLSLDAATLLATGERALSGGDAARGLRSYQRAIDQYGDTLLKRDEQTLVGVAALVGERLRNLDETNLAAYRQQSGRRAEEALSRAGGDATALGEVAVAYPATAAAATALTRIADLALEAGHGNRAAAALGWLSAGTNAAAAAQLDARRAYALELTGDHAGAAAAYAALLEKHGTATVTVRGGAMPLKAFVAERRAAIAARPTSPDWPTAGGSPARSGAGVGAPKPIALLTETLLPVPLSEQVAAHRFAPSTYHHLGLQPAVQAGVAYLASDQEVFAIGLDNGGLRWRSGGVEQGSTVSAANFAGNRDGTVSVADGVVVARVRRGDVRVIEARDAATGALRWATGTVLGNSDAISPGTVTDGLVYAVFNERDNRARNTLAAFDLVDGSLRWRTPLADGVANLVTSTQQEIPLGEHLAAPAVAGGEIYVATDMGGVVAADALTGRVRWAATYARARLDPQASATLIRRLANRSPRVVVAGETVYLAPRDSLALLAIRRDDGAVRWRLPFSDASALIGVSGDALFIQGDGIACLAVADGSERWRWRGGALHGLSGLGSGRLYASSTLALVELDSTDGHVVGRRPWSEFGLSAAVGNSIILGDRLLAVGEDRLVQLGTGDTKAAQRRVVPVVTMPALSGTGLPAAPLAAPLALRWRLAAAGAAAVLPVGNAVYADLGDRLVRLGDDGEQIAWAADSAGPLDALVPAGGLLLALHERAVVARQAQDGRLLWTQGMTLEDSGFILDQDDERKRERRGGSLISGDATLVALRPLGASSISLFDAATGNPRGRLNYPGTLITCVVAGGRVATVRQLGQKLVVDVRTVQGEVVWSEELRTVVQDLRQIVTALDATRTTLVIAGGRLLTAIDLAKPAVRWLETPDLGEMPSVTFASERLCVFARRQGQQWMLQVFESATGKTIGTVETQRKDRVEGAEAPLIVGTRWLSCTDQRQRDRWVVVCRDLAKPDQEQWATDIGERHRRNLAGRAVVGSTLVLITADDWGRRFTWITLDLGNGRVTGTGRVDGLEPAEHDEEVTVVALGNLVLCAGQQGVVAIGGLPPAPPDALKAALAQLRRSDRTTATGDLLLTMQTPPEAPALASERSPRVDGQLDEWSGEAAIVLDQRRQVRGGDAWRGRGDLAAQARVQWDATSVYVAVTVADDQWQPAVAGADLDEGDSLVLGIDPDPTRDGGEIQPLVLTVALVDGRTRLVQRSGRAAGQVDEDYQPQGDDGAHLNARVIRTASGWNAEIAVPWSMLRVNPSERPGWRTDLGLGLMVIDRDGAQRQAIEWGAGLFGAVSDRRFGRVKCIDLTGERIAGFRRFIDLLGDHAYAWRFTRRIANTHLGAAGLPARIAEVERYVSAQPQSGSTAIALAELVRLRRELGDGDPAAAVAQVAAKAKVPARALGDAIGPSALSGKQGRALRQWVRIDAERPPLELMIQVRTKDSDWNQRAFWGQDVIQHGEPATVQRWNMGPLPAPGAWTALIIPLAALALDGREIDNLAFTVHGGDVRWGASEFLDGEKVTVLVDPAKPPRFDRDVQVTTVDGRQAHGRGPQGSESTHRLADNGAIAVSVKLPEPAAPDRARLERYAEAARLISRTDEAMDLLSWSEALCTGDGAAREAQLIGHYQAFLAADPQTPQAARVLTHLRQQLEGWSDGKDVPRRTQAISRIEALMDAVKLPRDARRAFYGGYAPVLTEWRTIGFFDPGKGAANLGETLPVERGALDFTQTYALGDGRTLGWSAVTGDWQRVVPARGGGGNERKRWTVTYVATRIEVPAAMEAMLYLGVRGRAVVLLNGKRLGGVLTGDDQMTRDSIALPVKLAKGLNEVLIKLSERDGNPQFVCRFGDRSGKPLDGLVPRLPPDVARAKVENPTTVTLLFSTVVDPVTAGNAGNYALDREGMVSAVKVGKDLRTVTVTVSALGGAGDYILRLSGITSANGTPVTPGTRVILRPPSAGDRGLRAEFFSGREFTERLTGRIDNTVDFTWEDGEQPDPGVPAENFCVRWTTQLTIPKAGRWNFHVTSDDGCRLWLDDKQLIDAWVDRAATESSGATELKAGVHKLRLEYFQGGSGKEVHLSWEGPEQEKAIIPAERMAPGK